MRLQTETVQSMKFGNKSLISSHIFLGMWLFMHAGIKNKTC